MRINVLLHDFSPRHPFGGIKQQYEIANRLSERGHDVAVYHSLNFDRRVIWSPRSIAGILRANLRRRRAVEWFALRDGVRCRFVPRLWPRLIRRADVTCVSSALVAERLAHRHTRTGRRLYFVYELPVWRGGREDLRQRLARQLRRTDMLYIASGTAVAEMLEELGTTPAATIFCGIDLPDISLVTATNARPPVVGFALRPEQYKGVDDLLEAIKIVRKQYPDAAFESFGRYRDDAVLPDDVVVHGYLDDVALAAFYRRIMMFVSPSHSEGWGLTVTEAMANGAAVVVTQDGGSRDFAIPNETALTVPSGDPPALAVAISQLLTDGELRSRLVEGALERCQKMSWDVFMERLEPLLRPSKPGHPFV